MALLKRTKASVYGLENSLSTLATDISSEASRAALAEGSLQTGLTAEVTRAQAAEGSIIAAAAAETTRVNGEVTRLEGLVSTEATRAQGIEGSIQSALNAEITRATGVEGNLDTAIKAEETRAKGAEGDLSTLTTTVKTSLVAAINEVAASSGADLQDLVDRVDIIDGASTVDGSFRKAIADVVGAAPEALDTLKEIATALNNDPQLDSTLRTLISTSITAAKDELKGAVSQSFDTLKELEDGLAAETTRAQAAEGSLQSSLNAEVTRATGAEATLDGAIKAEETRAKGEESRIEGEALKKADNLAAVADKAVARTNLSVYSKAEVDSAIGGQSTKTMNASGVIANDKVTFAKAPIGGTDGIAFASVRIFGVVAGNAEVYDECQVTISEEDTSGKTFNISGDSAGVYDGKTCVAFIAYNPAAV